METLQVEQSERSAQAPLSRRPSPAVVLSIAVVLVILGSGVYVLGFYLK
jgi:hypothetical protein